MDQTEMTPANENPWYLMMTLYGEQEGDGIDRELAARNRSLWNAWICQGMTEARRAEIAGKIGIEVEETEWSEETAHEVQKQFAKRAKDSESALEIPDPTERVDLRQIAFSNTVVLEKAIFLWTYFDGAHFGEWTSFRGAHFGETTYFDGAHFGETTYFRGAHFGETTSFSGAHFGETTYFDGAHFGETTYFGDAHFGERTFFSDAHFGETTYFRGAHFGETTYFDGAHFGETTYFNGAQFHGLADFRRSMATGLMSFKGRENSFSTSRPAHFGTKTLFSEAHFKGRVDFYQRRFGPYHGRASVLTFANAIFEAPVSFEEAEFPDIMPVLSNTTLPASTKVTAENSHWPPRPGPLNFITCKVPFRKLQDHAKVKESAGALRHAMARQMLPEEEHFFFRREMYAGARCGPWVQGIFTRAFFELPSDYGYSIGRPAVLLGAVWLLGCLFYWLKAGFASGVAAGYSFATMFKFFGLQRTFMGDQTKELAAIPWGEPVAAAQTVLAFVLLFFLGLGLRTRFRLR